MTQNSRVGVFGLGSMVIGVQGSTDWSPFSRRPLWPAGAKAVASSPSPEPRSTPSFRGSREEMVPGGESGENASPHFPHPAP